MGWPYARRYPHVPEASVTAIADLIPERLEARTGVQTNVSEGIEDYGMAQAAHYGEGLDSIRNADVDVVDICLPTLLSELTAESR